MLKQIIHSPIFLWTIGVSFVSAFIYLLADMALSSSKSFLLTTPLTIGFIVLGFAVVFCLFKIRYTINQTSSINNDQSQQIIGALKTIGFIVIAAIAFSLVISAVAILLQITMATFTETQSCNFLIAVITQTLAALIVPFALILLFGAPSTSVTLETSKTVDASQLFSPANILKQNLALYPPLTLCAIAAFAVFHLASFSIGLIPQSTLQGILHFLLNGTGGFIWISVIYSITSASKNNSRKDILSALPHVKHTKSQRHLQQKVVNVLSKGTACIISFVLAFSLGGKVSFAQAAEISAENAKIAETQEEKERSLTEDAPTPDRVEIETPTKAEPPNPTAEKPIDFYDQESVEIPGVPVAATEEATVFQRTEKQFTTVIGGQALVYTEDDGSIQAIDNTLIPKDDPAPTFPIPAKSEENKTDTQKSAQPDAYVNKANEFSAELPSQITKDRGLSLTAEGYKIELIPLDGDFTTSAAEDSAIRYSEVEEGIDYQYTLVGSVVKEDIILKHPVEQRDFYTEIKLPKNLKATLEEEIVVIKDTKNKTIASITAPEMVDASGNASENLRLSLEEKDNKSVIALTADWDWINSAQRAYPVRIDPSVNIGKSATTITCVEESWADKVIGDSNFLPVAYDDGKATGSGLFNGGRGHGLCRIYASFSYDFRKDMFDSRIDSATFSLYQFTTLSNGANKMGAYRVGTPWDYYTLSWNAQVGFEHDFIQYQNAHTTPSYVDWDVREAVNAWAQGIAPAHGLCIKAENERNMQCEVFRGNNSTTPPKLTIQWSTPDPVQTNYPLSKTTVQLRPVVEKSASGLQAVDGVFADGLATPLSNVAWQLLPRGDAGVSLASKSYKYPDSSSWESAYPKGTKYKDKLSNWQSVLFTKLDCDKIYSVKAQPVLNGQSGNVAESDKFLVYKAKVTDTLPYIASHYGIPLQTLAADNRVQDSLSIKDNTLFIRNPKTATAYNPKNLSVDQKKRIDSALMGRGKHCEYGYEPINLNTGNFTMERVDATIPEIDGDFTLTRTYNSKAADQDSSFGKGWSFTWDATLSYLDSNTLVYTAGDGKVLYFNRTSGNLFQCTLEPSLRIEGEKFIRDKQELLRWHLKDVDGTDMLFNEWGLLMSSTSSLGLTTKVERNTNQVISAIVSPCGFRYGVTYDANGHIVSATLPNGGVCKYSYDGQGNLISSTEANGALSRYEYDTAHRMVSWINPDGNRAIRNTYDGEGRVVCQEDVMGKKSYITYKDSYTSTTDALGNTTIYRKDAFMRTTQINYPDGTTVYRSYDSAGNLLADEEGTYTYNAAGKMTSQTSLDGIVTTYGYDSRNRLTKQTNPDGEVITYTYDNSGNLVSQKSSSGTSFTYRYDSYHRLLTATDADGIRVSYGYSGPWITTETNGLGQTATYAYDAMGRQISKTDPTGAVSRTMYDKAGNKIGEADGSGAYIAYGLTAMGYCTSITDARGYKTTFSLDKQGNVVALTDPNGNTERFTYNALGQKISHTDALGQSEYFTYDVRGRCISETNKIGATTTYTYDSRGNKTTETLPNGTVKTYEYDATYNMVLAQTDQLNHRTEYTYDAAGNLTSTTNPAGVAEYQEWNLGGRLACQVDALGNKTVYTYSAAGRPISIDVSGQIWTLTYNETGQISTLVDPEGNNWSYNYDSAGNLIKETDPEGNTTSYSYDGAGRPVSIEDAEGAITRNSYDGMGNLVASLDGLGNTTTYDYDAVGQLITISDPSGHRYCFTYDALGNRIEEIDGRGFRTTLEYDALGRCLSKTDPLGNKTEYIYDKSGNLLSQTDALGAVTTYEYDACNNLTKVVEPSGIESQLFYDDIYNLIGISDSAGRQWRYSYDSIGQQILQTDPLGRSVKTSYDPWGQITEQITAAGAITKYDYDKLGRYKSVTDALGNTTSYAYDKTGNLTLQIDALGNRSAYMYDRCGRMVAEIDPTGSQRIFSYDAAGNRISEVDGDGFRKTYAFDSSGNLTEETDALGHTKRYAYDSEGNLTLATLPTGRFVSFTYDANNSLLAWKDGTEAETSYAYDEVGNIVATKNPLGALTSYTYTMNSQLMSKTDDLGNITSYEYDQVGNLISISEPKNNTRTFAYDIAGRLIQAKTSLGRELSVAYDLNDNIVGVADNLGLTNTFAYDKLGHLLCAKDSCDNMRQWTYDGLGNATSYTNEYGATTTITYDANSRPIQIKDALGGITSYAYDNRGNLIEAINPSKIKTTFTYDKVGNLAEQTNASGTKTWHYDEDGRVIAAIDSYGTANAYNYDEAGRLVAVAQSASLANAQSAVENLKNQNSASLQNANKDADISSAASDIQTKSFSYDKAGNLTSTTDGLGNITNYTRDSLGRITEVTENETVKAAYTRDEAGNLIQSSDGLGNTTAYTYDSEGNLTSLSSPLEITETLERDKAGRVTSFTDGAGNTIKYTYNKEGNLASKTFPEDTKKSVNYEYDKANLVESRDDWWGNATYAYDEAGHLIEETDGTGHSFAYEYTPDGSLAKITYPDNTYAEYTYNDAGYLSTIKTDSGVWTIENDAEGRPVTLIRPDGSLTNWSRDGLGQVTKVLNKDSSDKVISLYEYEYNANGQIVLEKSDVEGLGTTTREFSYTPDNKLAECVSNTPNGKTVESFSYDKAGNKIEALRQSSEGTTRSLYEYDKDNRLVQAKDEEQTTIYTYNDAGNLLKKESSDGTSQTFRYDVDNKLEAVWQGDILSLMLAYDGDGQRVWQAAAEEVIIPPTQIEEPLPEAEATEQNAETKTDENISFEFPDTGDNLPPLAFAIAQGLTASLGIANPAASSALSQLLLGRWYGRVRGRDKLEADDFDSDVLVEESTHCIVEAEETKEQGSQTKLVGGAILTHLVEKIYINTSLTEFSEPLYEISEEGDKTNHLYTFTSKDTDADTTDIATNTEFSTTNKHSLSGGKNIPLMAGLEEEAVDKNLESAMPSASGGLPVSNVSSAFESMHLGTSEISFALDGRGSVSSVLDSKGEVIGSYSYNLTGQISAYSGTRCEYGWNAEPQDATTGLIYLRARFLMSTEGVFTSKDTYLGQVDNPASSNRYAYALGDPINIVDPSGHISRAQNEYLNRFSLKALRDEFSGVASRASRTISSVWNRSLPSWYTPPTRRGYSNATQRAPGQRSYRSTLSSYYSYLPSTYPSGSIQQQYQAWVMFNNGLITKETAEKYCGSAVYMVKNAPMPKYAGSTLETIVKTGEFATDTMQAIFKVLGHISDNEDISNSARATARKIAITNLVISVPSSIGSAYDYYNSHPDISDQDRIYNTVINALVNFGVDIFTPIPYAGSFIKYALTEWESADGMTFLEHLYVGYSWK